MSTMTMNGPGMFTVKPHFQYTRDQIELPTCMFKMKNVHEQSSSVHQGQEESGPLAALERRQENILTELKALENEVATLGVRFKSNKKENVTQQPTRANVQKTTTGTLTASKSVPSVDLGNVIHDIVIYANPTSPPLSLFVLYHTLTSQYRCRTGVHVHSSVKNVPHNLIHSLGNGAQIGRDEAQIGITLIWKDVSHGPELKVSAQSQTPIQGEANVARYLSRLISPRYDSAPIQHVCVVDDLLDLATYSILDGSSKEKAAALRTLNSLLGKSAWLGPSGDISVADVVVWSALHQTGMTKGAPANVQKWLKQCDGQNAFQSAQAAL